VKRVLIALLLLATAVVSSSAAQPPERAGVVDVRSVGPAPGTSFESLWVSYTKAERAGDAANARRIFQEIRRIRIERNVVSHDILGLALVAQGLERLEKGEKDRAEESFRNAIGLAPSLPDAQFALSLTDLSKGPLGFLPAMRHTAAGLFARLPTVRGGYHLAMLLVPVVLIALLATAAVMAVAFLLRRGALLRHDLAESLGPGRSASVSLAFYAGLLFLPVATFQGYGWLPFWWMALLFVYMGVVEKAVALVFVLLSLAVVPLTTSLEGRLLAARNPLFWAGVQAVEGAADPRSVALLDAAARKDPEDKDLVYLLAIHHRKAGRYDEAAGLYQKLLQAEPGDAIAKNNLANLEFARGEFQSAIARYKQGAEAGGAAPTVATFYYNQSLAHLQRFEYQPAQEAKSNADRLARSLIADYDRTWKYDKGDYAVVDLGLSIDQVSDKFRGTAQGVGAKNVVKDGAPAKAIDLSRAVLNRFMGSVVVFGLVVAVFSVWRRRMLTLQCLKCGQIFDARDHRGGAAVGLCPQCYHLFIVRDGVSAPARNRKLLEVQGWDERRGRVFRLLSVMSPGAGHVYAGNPLLGLIFALPWYLIIAIVAFAGRLLPVTEAPSNLSQPWGIGLAALLLLAIWVLANRLRPDFEVAVAVKRTPASRKPRTA
jgi:Tfp pilus assembly protein PilF